MVTELQKKMGGWIVELVAPALIMVMTGSLAFFLMEVAYFGSYPGRVGWVLALFIFASVLTSRISIMEGFDKATFYGMLLGGATIFVLTTLSNMSLFMAMAFIGVIWWFNSKLTWDCTVLDSTRDSTDRGLLQRFGLRSNRRNQKSSNEESDESETEPGEEIQGTSSNEAHKTSSWVSRIVSKKKVPNTPGVWVLILSLAAFPIFGFGQGFIEEEARRQNAFLYFCTYLAAGLGLLVTTALIGLQRYLMRRNATMPNSVALAWVSVGTLMIFVILVGAWMLPRPYSEYSVAENPFKYDRTSDWGSSRYSIGNEGKQESRDDANTDSKQKPSDDDKSGKGSPGGNQKGGQKKGGEKRSDSKKGESGGKSKQRPNSGNQNNSKGKRQDQKSSGNPSKDGKDSSKQNSKESQGGKQGDGGNQKSKGNEKSSRPKNNDNNSKSDKSNEKKSPGKESGKNGEQGSDKKSNKSEGNRSPENGEKQNGDKSGRKDNESKSNESKSNESGNQNQQQSKNNSRTGRPGKTRTKSNDSEKQKDNSKNSNKGNSQANSQQNPSRSMQWPSLRGILWILQWVVAIVLALVAIYFLWKYRQSLWQQLVGFFKGLGEFWANLWKRKDQQDPLDSDSTSNSKPLIRQKAFAEFANPFHAGVNQNWSMTDLVRYSFEALEAWGRERGCTRGEDETPHEFALKLAELDKNVGRSAKKLADFYCSIAFAKDRLDPKMVHNELVNLWSILQGQPVNSGFQPA